ncbi:MAG: bifunctional precorrin-2 dehydrogenase/sirohydrochlorin ferrochelatase [Armatimonadetes bacterium]|nr:bifunctional precorrin-2 dehydrogenase/sirohydrochlorin ferrochelatase [Armatimonadota bacterium]
MSYEAGRMTSFYPVYLDLRDRPCVVVGGGAMAESKVLGLLDAGAQVTVVAPEVSEGLSDLEARGRIRVLRRSYRRGDLDGARVVIAACEDRSVNHQIWQEAEDLGVPVNAVDDMPHCNFIAPAVHRQGDLAVAISTGGKSPALAVRLRDRIASLVGPEYGAFLTLLGAWREEVAARISGPRARAALWYRVVDSDAIDLVRGGDLAGANARIARLLSEARRELQAAQPSAYGEEG